jgi:DNA-binding HxlR family transcriptional regulator
MAYKQNDCPVKAALSIIGGKWKPLILAHLLQGTRRYGELNRLIPGVTKRVLTLQLRELESAGVIRRVEYQGVLPRVEYSITDVGRNLEPALNLLSDWGKKHLLA